MVNRGPWFYMDSVPEPKVEAKPVSWARRCALDAVMAWVRDREKRGTPLGPDREYVEGVTGITTISGAGKVYASEAVDRMEKLLVDTGASELRDALAECAQVLGLIGASGHRGYFDLSLKAQARANELVSRLAKAGA